MARLLFVTTILATVIVSGCQPTNVQEQSTTTSSSLRNRSAELHVDLGIRYLREGNLDFAFSRLSRALDLEPNNAAAHNAMGLLHERLGDAAKADGYYRRAVTLNPTDASAQTNLGSSLCRAAKYEEGEKFLLQAAKQPLHKSPEVIYTNLGLCALLADKPERAETYFRRSLEINPKMSGALIRMSELSYRQDRYLSARAYLQRYLVEAEHSPASLWLGVRIERELGDKNAEASYGMLLRSKFPDAAQTRLLEESKNQ